MQTFAEAFCERHHIAQEKFARAVFWRCLHRHAWPLAPVLFLVAAEYFDPDFDLIANAGRLTSPAGLHEELVDFCADSRNHGLLRSTLKIRVSGARLLHLAHRTLRAETPRPGPALRSNGEMRAR